MKYMFGGTNTMRGYIKRILTITKYSLITIFFIVLAIGSLMQNTLALIISIVLLLYWFITMDL